MNNFERVIQYFRSTDMISLALITNADKGSIWFTNQADGDDLFCARFYTVSETEYNCEEKSLTLHGRSGNCHTRMKYDLVENFMHCSVLNITNNTSKDVYIYNASTVNEAEFFQKSTIEDVLDLEFHHISTLIELTNKIVSFAEGVINANRTSSPATI